MNVTEMVLPIQASIIIFAIEELHLFKSIGTWFITGNRGMHGKECVEGCGTSFLGSDN